VVNAHKARSLLLLPQARSCVFCRGSGCGTMRHYSDWLISCPESKELRTPFKGPRAGARGRLCCITCLRGGGRWFDVLSSLYC